MKYTFTTREGKPKTVIIEDAWIKKQTVNLGISPREAINMWLCDEGYIDNETVRELSERAAQNKCGAVGASTKPRKKPERKPDEDKRAIIKALNEYLNSAEFTGHSGRTLNNVEVTNIERIITFTLGDDKYELTLSKKRKPKVK